MWRRVKRQPTHTQGIWRALKSRGQIPAGQHGKEHVHFFPPPKSSILPRVIIIIIIPSYWSVMPAIDVASALGLPKVSVSIYLGCGRLLRGGAQPLSRWPHPARKRGRWPGEGTGMRKEIRKNFNLQGWVWGRWPRGRRVKSSLVSLMKRFRFPACFLVAPTFPKFIW